MAVVEVARPVGLGMFDCSEGVKVMAVAPVVQDYYLPVFDHHNY